MERMIDKSAWISLLRTVGFEEKDFDKVIEYVKTHAGYEIHSPIYFQGNPIQYSTLAMALQVLKKLDLDKVYFQDQPVASNEKGIGTTTQCIKFRFDDEELMCIRDIETHMSHSFIEETVKVLEEKMKTEELHIYVLFNNINTKDRICSVYHRFGTRVL